MAGDRARRSNYLYGASKAGLSVFLDGLDLAYRERGVRVLCVKPGFVRTAMTAGLPVPPFAGEPAAVAAAVVRAIDRGRHQVYAPGHLAVDHAGHPRAATRRPAPRAVLAPLLTERESMPKIWRVYSGTDGQSHVEEIALAMKPFTDTEGAHGEGTPMQPVAGLAFRVAPPGYVLDWHCAPRRQYSITLSGQAEIEVGDGTVVRVGPGDVLLAEDLTGRGHVTRAVGTEPRFYAIVPLT